MEDSSSNEYQTPDYIQVLQNQISQMANNNSKGIFIIDKYTLTKLVKLLIRDEEVRKASRELHRRKHPEIKIRGENPKQLAIIPIYKI